uniref:Uncharacterized protein n=1 Tax=Arundo donax TaxID=35708 RepID=A0A0A8ZU48_ARUDO
MSIPGKFLGYFGVWAYTFQEMFNSLWDTDAYEMRTNTSVAAFNLLHMLAIIALCAVLLFPWMCRYKPGVVCVLVLDLE